MWSSVDNGKADEGYDDDDDDDDDDEDNDNDDDDDDDDRASTDSDNTDPDRFVSFKVAKTNDQEENVAVRAGFVVSLVCQSVT